MKTMYGFFSRLFQRALRSQAGAFTITLFRWAVLDSSFLPANSNEIADLTMNGSSGASSGTVDTGIEGNKWVRVRALLKTISNLQAGDTVTVTLQGGTSTGITAPTNIAQQTVQVMDGDTALQFQFEGWSNAGFQSYRILASSSRASATAVLDVLVDIT